MCPQYIYIITIKSSFILRIRRNISNILLVLIFNLLYCLSKKSNTIKMSQIVHSEPLKRPEKNQFLQYVFFLRRSQYFHSCFKVDLCGYYLLRLINLLIYAPIAALENIQYNHSILYKAEQRPTVPSFIKNQLTAKPLRLGFAENTPINGFKLFSAGGWGVGGLGGR